MKVFAQGYTDAWNSGDPSRVAAHFRPEGSIQINGGEPYAERAGVERMAAGFMRDIPDLKLTMTGLEESGDRVIFYWSFTGHHAETGKPMLVVGNESWVLHPTGLIEQSTGTFDAGDYDRQAGLEDH